MPIAILPQEVLEEEVADLVDGNLHSFLGSFIQAAAVCGNGEGALIGIERAER